MRRSRRCGPRSRRCRDRDASWRDALGANVTHRIVIRMRADITTRHRLREGARIFRIVALRDQDGAGRFLEIDAEERVD